MKKIISFALAVVMVMTLLPMTMVSVFAAETDTTEKNITLGASHIKGAQASNVYFGTYQQSSDGNGGYNIDPIKWRVLSNGDGKLFLLADQNLDVFQYNTADTDVTWETSTMRSWLNGYAASENVQSTDYTSDNFLDTAFSSSEQLAIADTLVINATYDGTSGTNPNPDYTTSGGSNTTDKVFLLSIAEVLNTGYGFTADTNSTDTRVSTNTAYVAAGGKLDGNMNEVGRADYWWLRSPGLSSSRAACVSHNGNVDAAGNDVNDNGDAVRPAFNLNSASVLFTSAAKDGKTAFSANTALTGSDGYKLTMLDTSRSGFSAEILKTANKTYVKYQGATTGANEHITAMIVNANGDVTYYGSLKKITETADASGMFEIDLSGMNSGDKVYILNEQWNGDYKTDYASAMNAVQISKFVENDTGSVEVTYGVSESYTVTIPADITLSANGETDVEVKTSSVVVEYGKQLTVSVSSNNYSEGKWYLVDNVNASNKLEYSIKNGDDAVASGDTILTVAAGTTEEQKVTLAAKLVDKATYSGTYKDTLTFSVSVASSSGGTTETWTTVTDENGLKTALEAGGKVKLGADIELENKLNISTQSDSDLTIVLDLNGYTITSPEVSDELLLFVNDRTCNLKVTIKDTSVNQTGKITGISTGVCAVVCVGGTEITVEGGTFSGSCALSLFGSAKAVINAGTLCSNNAESWALSFNGSSSSAVINGGTIKNTAGGMAIHTIASTQTLKITGGKITGKILVSSDSPASITITGGTYSFDPTDYVDTNSYTVTNNTDGTWTVSTKTSD